MAGVSPQPVPGPAFTSGTVFIEISTKIAPQGERQTQSECRRSLRTGPGGYLAVHPPSTTIVWPVT